MKEKAVLTPNREKILAVVDENPKGLLLREITDKTAIPRTTVLVNVNILESRLLLKTQKRGRDRIVFPNSKVPAENLAKEKKEHHFLSDGEIKLMKEFALDELDIRILRAEGRTPQEVAEELGILLMEAKARIERSIPAKFGVGFEEARKKTKNELVEP